MQTSSPGTNLSLRAKGILVVSLPAILNLACLATLLSIKDEAERQVEKQLFGASLGALTARLEHDYNSAATSASKFHSSRSDGARSKLERSLKDLGEDERQLYSLMENKPEAAILLAQYKKDAGLARDFLNNILYGVSTHYGGDLAPRIFQSEGQRLIGNMLEDSSKLSKLSTDSLQAGRESSQTRALLTNLLIATMAGNVALAFLLALFLSNDIGKRIAVVRKNALALASGEKLSAPLLPGDEISELDKSLHISARALQEAKRKESALVDNAVDVLCSLDSQLKFTRVSSAAGRVWGYEPEELIGMRFIRLLSADCTDSAVKVIDKVMAEETVENIDARITKPDGKVLDVRIAAYWSALEKSLYCVVRDVTREKEFERIKQRLMDTVAHDLRSPISSIKTVLESLSSGLLGALSDKALERISKAEISSDRLLRLINDLLDYDKFESGQFTLNIKEQSMRDIIDGALLSIDSLIEDKQLKVEVAGDDLAVRADADRMTQVLVNLLSNAVKYSPEKGTLKIDIVAKEKAALIEITDQGPGIADDFKPQVFERFKSTEKGTGLGLPIARQIVEAHEGEIGLRDATKGGGSVFWFTLLRPFTTAVVSLLSIFALQVFSGSPADAAPQKSESTPATPAISTWKNPALSDRKVTFPKGVKPAGNLVVISFENTGEGSKKPGKLLGPAQGTVKVPAMNGLALMVTPEGVPSLPALSHLNNADIYKVRMHRVPVNTATITAVSKIPGIMDLDLSDTDTRDEHLPILANCISLVRLSLERTLIGGGTFKSLYKLRQLRSLDLSQNKLVTGTTRDLAAACPRLNSLNLENSGVTDADMVEIAKIPHLKKLNLDKNPRITEECIDQLTRLKELEKLHLSGTAIAKAALPEMRQKMPHCRFKF